MEEIISQFGVELKDLMHNYIRRGLSNANVVHGLRIVVKLLMKQCIICEMELREEEIEIKSWFCTKCTKIYEGKY